MKQLSDEVICKYCLGCNRLEDPYFTGYKRCNGFVAGYKDWQDRYYNANKNKSSKINFKQK